MIDIGLVLINFKGWKAIQINEQITSTSLRAPVDWS